MKNLITLSIMFIIASMLFSSCKSNVSITKRHYNSGYYVSYNNGKQNVHARKQEEKVKTINTIPSPVTKIQDRVEDNTTSRFTKPVIEKNNNVLLTSINKTESKSKLIQNVKEVIRHNLINNADPNLQVKQIITKSNKVNNTMVDDGLSLLWLVVVVLLILWAIGYLAGGLGLGGLLNLLLLIALILFILWLLRIV